MRPIQERRRNRATSFRPRLESLEARVLPAQFIVTNSSDSGMGSLRQAVLDANTLAGQDGIIFDPSHFGVPRTITLTTGELPITDGVTIVGPGSSLLTVSGNKASRIFNTSVPQTLGTLGITGLTFTSGRATTASASHGGAVSIGDSTSITTLENCVFIDNSATDGGGAIAVGGFLTLINCKITGNSAGQGGGIVQGGNAQTLTLDTCIVSNNQAVNGFGGGIASETAGTAQLVINSTSITNNSAFSDGGGIWKHGGGLTLQNSTVSGNTGSTNGKYGFGGGGIFLRGYVPSLISNSTISANSTSLDGGGIRLYRGGGLSRMQNCTIVGNVAGLTGGGIAESSFSNAFDLHSTIVAGNTSSTAGPDINFLEASFGGANGDNNLIGIADRGQAIFSGAGNLLGILAAPLNPRLGPLADNGGPTFTHALMPGSPAFNAGSNPAGLAYDQRGPAFPRTLYDRPDIGAVESRFPNPSGHVNHLPAIRSPGPAPNSITVTYFDNVGIDVSTFGVNDIQILDPANTPLPIVGVSIDNPTNGSPRTATYTFTVPGGSWDRSDNGVYQIDMRPGQVFNIDGPMPSVVAAGNIGEFTVAVPPTFVVDELTDLVDGNTTVGHLSIREALNLANASADLEIIAFDPVLFSTHKTVTLTGGELSIADAVQIIGPGAPYLSISGNNSSRVFSTTSAPSNAQISISGLTITRGRSNFGGGLYVLNVLMTLTDCIIENNYAQSQGGGINSNAELTMVRCVVRNNTSDLRGGGLFCPGANVFDSTFVNNSARFMGGGIHTNGGSSSFIELNIVGSTIAGNTVFGPSSGSTGGGLSLEGGFFEPGEFTITNSTISNNWVMNGSGGGIGFATYGDALIRNSTFTANRAGTNGGGIACLSQSGNLVVTPTIESSIVAGNFGAVPDLFIGKTATQVLGNNNLIGVADVGNFILTGVGNDTGTLAMPRNPMLGPLANNGGPTHTHALLPGSPAVDAGHNAAGLSTDQRGGAHVRVDGSAADIGAFESQPVTPFVQTVSVNGGAVQRSRVTSLTVTFDSVVTFGGPVVQAFVLNRIDGLPVVFQATSNTMNGATVVTLDNFSGVSTEFGSLADGRYTLRAFASQINTGNFDGNGDGLPGDDYLLIGTPANGLFSLFGDADGNGTVSITDVIAFVLAFGGSSTIFDFDNQGGVGTVDFNQFRQRFGSSV